MFHLIPERRPLLQSFRTMPRACEVRGHIYVVGGLNRHGKDPVDGIKLKIPIAIKNKLRFILNNCILLVLKV